MCCSQRYVAMSKIYISQIKIHCEKYDKTDSETI